VFKILYFILIILVLRLNRDSNENLSVDAVRYIDMRYSELYNVPPCLSEEEGCNICPVVLEATAYRGETRVFPFLSMKGDMTHANQLSIMAVASFQF
jgi:hypothetical protein